MHANQKFLKWASPKIPEMGQPLNWASPFREFPIWAGPFQEFPVWAGPFREFQKTFEKMSFFGMFIPLPRVIFWLLTLIQSDDMDILQKELVQNAHSCVK